MAVKMMVPDKGYDVCRGEDVHHSHLCCLGGIEFLEENGQKKLLNEKD